MAKIISNGEKPAALAYQPAAWRKMRKAASLAIGGAGGVSAALKAVA